MKKRNLVALVVLTLVIASVTPVTVVRAAEPTSRTVEYMDKTELNRRGLSVGTKTYTKNGVKTTVSVTADSTNSGMYVVITTVHDPKNPGQKVPSSSSSSNNSSSNSNNSSSNYNYDYYDYDYDYYGGYDYNYGYNDSYYGYYSERELRQYAREDFADTGIKKVAKKNRGKVKWKIHESDQLYVIAKVTVTNRRHKKKVYWQFTDGEETVFLKNNPSRLIRQAYSDAAYLSLYGDEYSGSYYDSYYNSRRLNKKFREVDVSDIKDFLRR